MPITPESEFSVEASNGYLLIAIKIPTSTCTACGAEYTHIPKPERVEHVLRACAMPIDAVFDQPWCGTGGWKFIYIDGRRALVCSACAAPVAEAEREGQAKADAAAREVCKKIDARRRG